MYAKYLLAFLILLKIGKGYLSYGSKEHLATCSEEHIPTWKLDCIFRKGKLYLVLTLEEFSA